MVLCMIHKTNAFHVVLVTAPYKATLLTHEICCHVLVGVMQDSSINLVKHLIASLMARLGSKVQH